jgi:antitoxin component HigA of HigAB toxin-antitoxin module
MVKVKRIENELDYEKALVQLRKLRNSEKGSDKYNQKEILKILIINYENKNYPFGKDNFDQWVNDLKENSFLEKN